MNKYKGQVQRPLAGFSFDPLKEKTGLWSNFATSLFYIPKFMLSLFNGQAYLTTNVICSQQDDITLYENGGRNEREELLLKQKNK